MRTSRVGFLTTKAAVVLALASVGVLSAQAQKFKVLHTFHGRDGAEPVGVLIRDAAGNIYGTTGVWAALGQNAQTSANSVAARRSK
jgi:hypothetical protein